ncbi:PiggyBac transposable element-derived protein 3 [Eumeta japonica]|uniref:PiggyBac transposable element-derived protein 3 n=1 Tax=Eumeta variegata TaxID=151549 RepID=A0A4C1XP83_EUMVA|nr:PiggyBac transposable element-derived protein 3 [Eumeta japonica]
MANDRPLAAHEILDALENVSDNEEDYRERLICILPPPVDPDCLTDEDSIMVSDTEEEPSDSTGRTKRRRTYAWRKRDLAKNPVNWPDVQGACQDKRPIEWFENFLDEDVISLLVSESNKYAVKKNLPGDITTEDMKCFIGILLSFLLEEHYSVDEAMIPYYGRHGCKQHIKGKPIRYGFKAWVGATRLGIASNAVGINPKQSAKRFSQSEKRNIVIEEPHMVSIYNKYMGGVDRSDENISHYRIGIRGAIDFLEAEGEKMNDHRVSWSWSVLERWGARVGPWDAVVACAGAGTPPQHPPPNTLLKATAGRSAALDVRGHALISDRLPTPLAIVYAATFTLYRLLRYMCRCGRHTDWLEPEHRLTPGLHELKTLVDIQQLGPVLDQVYLPQDFESALAHACSDEALGTTVIRFP